VMTRAETRFRYSAKRTGPFNRRERQFSRLLAVEVCASAVVMLDTQCTEVVRRVLATHSIRQFSLRFPSRASPYAITFQLESTTILGKAKNYEGKSISKLQIQVATSVFELSEENCQC
jgi:hypothetical protein